MVVIIPNAPCFPTTVRPITAGASAFVEERPMSLGQVQATVAFVLGMIGTWTGLLVSLAFLLPRQTRKAEETLSNTPWLCFGGGLGLGVLLVIALFLINLPLPPLKLIGFILLLVLGSIMAL